MPDTVISGSKDKVIVPASHFASPKLHPVNVPSDAHFEHIPNINRRGIADARKLFEVAQTRDVGELNARREHPDPRLPAAATYDELAKEAAKRKAEFLHAYDATLKTLDEEIADNARHLEAMGGFKANPQAAEVRQVLREMKPQEREALIGNSVEALDESVLGCVFNGAHPITVGVSAEFLSAMRNRYLQKVAPDHLQHREQLAAVRKQAGKAKPLMEAAYDHCGQGIEHYAEQIAKAEAARGKAA